MKKLIAIVLFLCALLLANYIKLDFLTFINAEDKKEVEKGSDETVNIKTDLDELRYDYDDKEIEEFLEQYNRIVEIKKRKHEVEDEILTLENEIKTSKNDIDQMKKLYSQLDKKFNKNLQTDESNIEKLIKTYETMKPNEVSPLLISHKLEVVLELLEGLKTAKAGLIFSEMIKLDRARVVQVAEKYSGFDTKYTKELREKEFNEKDLYEKEEGDSF